MAAIRQYHRLPSRERGALRPLRHAKCVEALRKQRASRFVLKPIPETRGISVRDRECFEAPTLLLQNRPLGDRSQPVSAVVLRSNGIGEITPDERERLIAANDLDGAVQAIKSKRGQEARQAQHMIKMSVRQQHVRKTTEPEPRPH